MPPFPLALVKTASRQRAPQGINPERYQIYPPGRQKEEVCQNSIGLVSQGLPALRTQYGDIGCAPSEGSLSLEALEITG